MGQVRNPLAHVSGGLYTGAGNKGKPMSKPSAIWALGAMSGTSLDGVDAAMVLTDGVEVFEFGESWVSRLFRG